MLRRVALLPISGLFAAAAIAGCGGGGTATPHGVATVSPNSTVIAHAILLVNPQVVGIDLGGRIIVGNEGTSCCNGTGSVVIYSSGANGNVSPVTSLPADAVSESISRFAAAANGNVAPIQVIKGPATQLGDIWDVNLR